MADFDELQLIKASQGGDRAAFGQLVEHYQDRLFHAVAHFIGSASEAEDVVQDAFVQAYLKLGSFQGNSAFYTWLYRIAFNAAISRKRYEQRRSAASIDQQREAGGMEPVDDGEAPSARLERAELAAQVRRAMAMLNDEHREILILREIDGLEYEQIAEVMQIQLGTVRSRLHRARVQLHNKLKEVGAV